MPITSSRQIGQLVRQIRTSKGISQTALAKKIGATRQWIGMLEQGKPRLELELTLRALVALNLVVSITDKPHVNSAQHLEENPKAKQPVHIDLDSIIDAHLNHRAS